MLESPRRQVVCADSSYMRCKIAHGNRVACMIVIVVARARMENINKGGGGDHNGGYQNKCCPAGEHVSWPNVRCSGFWLVDSRRSNTTRGNAKRSNANDNNATQEAMQREAKRHDTTRSKETRNKSKRSESALKNVKRSNAKRRKPKQRNAKHSEAIQRESTRS